MTKLAELKDIKMVMRILVFTILLTMGWSISYGQSEMSAFTATGRAGTATTFVTDYQSMGINPANLGWKAKNEKMISFGLLEGGFSMYSEALAKSELVASLKTGNTEFTTAEKIKAAEEFTQTDLSMNFDLQWIGIGVQPSKKVGGFAFGVKERFQWFSNFGETLSQILFLGYQADYFTKLILNDGDTIDNISDLPDTTIAKIVKGYSDLPKKFSDIIDDSRMSMSWYREFNLSYGRVIIDKDKFSLYGGIGLKYLSGMAMFDISATNGDLEAFSAVTPAFGINYGDSVADDNPSTVTSSGLFPKAVGTGFGFDIGFSAILVEKLKIGIALNDIGSITWNGNVYKASDDKLVDMTSAGFASYNIIKESEDIMGDSGVFNWSGVHEKKVSLPTNLRFGASFMPNEKFEAGFDLILPLNKVAGNYQKVLLGVGLDVIPVPWFKVSTGFSVGGNYGFNLPLGLLFSLGEGTWEVGVASRDIITFFSKNSPTLSASVGLLRFRF
ncbi:MAG: hypothetical protein COB85_02210 [Bacteroidetes bacterium]|nr:MAG: hypothetical protein COB85_02210 [Bacteroidota bacterium]